MLRIAGTAQRCNADPMPAPVAVSRSRRLPVPVERAFAETLAWPLEDLFNARYGPIPPIKRVTQDGDWATAGQTRIIYLTGGGSMREELRSVEAPREFTYQLTQVTGPMKPLASSIDGTWSFEPSGTGCRVTWTWRIHPKSALVGRLVLPVFARFWNGYARLGLERLEDLLVGD